MFWAVAPSATWSLATTQAGPTPRPGGGGAVIGARRPPRRKDGPQGSASAQGRSVGRARAVIPATCSAEALARSQGRSHLAIPASTSAQALPRSTARAWLQCPPPLPAPPPPPRIRLADPGDDEALLLLAWASALG
jgi:hypothetical protein